MKIVAAFMLCFAIVGCRSSHRYYFPNDLKASGTINHVVFFDLQDPADADELIDDCYDLFRIRGAKAGYAGRHFDVGRESVLQDYDVGFFVAFNSQEAYQEYVQHPKHIALVEKWRPRWDSIRVYDVGDARMLKRKSD